jgi:hypothetical protein
MPDKYLESVPIDEIQQLLDSMQSVEAVADHFNVSSRTVTRYIKGKLFRHFCWKKTPPLTPKTLEIGTRTKE